MGSSGGGGRLNNCVLILGSRFRLILNGNKKVLRLSSSSSLLILLRLLLLMLFSVLLSLSSGMHDMWSAEAVLVTVGAVTASDTTTRMPADVAVVRDRSTGGKVSS